MAGFDGPWKMGIRCFFPHLMATLFPEIHSEIDWKRETIFLDKELQPLVRYAKRKLPKPKKRPQRGVLFVDMLARVTLLGGTSQLILVHIEFQNEFDPDFEKRMFHYNIHLIRAHEEDILSLAVLGDLDPDWRPGYYSKNVLGNLISLRFQTAKLLDYEEDLETLANSVNPFALMVAAHLMTNRTRKNPASRASWKYKFLRLARAQHIDRETLTDLFFFVDKLMTLPSSLDETVWTDVKSEWEKEVPMAYTGVMGIAQREATRDARQVGLVEGTQQEARQTVLRIAEKKFGQLPSRIAELVESASVEKLRDWIDNLVFRDSLDEVFG